jgi:hypothetical protein
MSNRTVRDPGSPGRVRPGTVEEAGSAPSEISDLACRLRTECCMCVSTC